MPTDASGDAIPFTHRHGRPLKKHQPCTWGKTVLPYNHRMNSEQGATAVCGHHIVVAAIFIKRRRRDTASASLILLTYAVVAMLLTLPIIGDLY